MHASWPQSTVCLALIAVGARLRTSIPGRVRLNRGVRPMEERPSNERTMVAEVTITYLREGSYPEDVIVCSGIGRIGHSSWTIEQAMFQMGECIATCDTVVVCRTDNAAQALRPELRAQLEKMRATGGTS